MYKIKACRRLVDKILYADSDMMVAGVVCGNNAGVIWADDADDPAFCIVWSEYLEGFQFMGSRCDHIVGPGLRAFVDHTLMPFLKAKQIGYFEFACDRPEWAPAVRGMFSDRKIERGVQHVYKLAQGEAINRGIALPSGYDALAIDEALAQKEPIRSEIGKTWGSAANFLERGMGFAALRGDEICSLAKTHFRYKDIHSVGVETFDPHKRKGLSGHLSMVLIDSLLRRGDDIWWDCMESNIASQRTAKKIGLTFSHDYELFWFPTTG